jgi:hypothetical protein
VDWEEYALIGNVLLQQQKLAFVVAASPSSLFPPPLNLRASAVAADGQLCFETDRLLCQPSSKFRFRSFTLSSPAET